MLGGERGQLRGSPTSKHDLNVCSDAIYSCLLGLVSSARVPRNNRPRQAASGCPTSGSTIRRQKNRRQNPRQISNKRECADVCMTHVSASAFFDREQQFDTIWRLNTMTNSKRECTMAFKVPIMPGGPNRAQHQQLRRTGKDWDPLLYCT